MGLISAFTLIRTISLFHITAAYFFLTSPRVIADQNVVVVLGESMRMQWQWQWPKNQKSHATTLDKPSEAAAFAGVLLAFLGIADLTAASLEELVALQYWLSNVPVRLTFLFGLTGYVYLFKEGGTFGPSSPANAGIGELLQNSMVFAFGFFEIAIWFWIFTSLREERDALARRHYEELKAQEDRL